jgi:hypothetical protein
MKRHLFFLFTLLTALPLRASDSTSMWKETLILEGQHKLAMLKRENALRDSQGLSQSNNYVLVVGDGNEYPDATFIRQRRGAGRGGEESVPYLLDVEHLQSLNKTLQDMNATSVVKTYLLLVHFMPLEFINEIPDNQSIADFFAGQKTDMVQVVAGPMTNEAKDIVTRITGSQLDQEITPTLFCGFVHFKVFKNNKEGISQWVYYPRNSQIEFDEQYKRMLHSFVQSAKWTTGDLAKVTTLVETIRLHNEEYKRVKGILRDLSAIVDPEIMEESLRGLGDNALAAFNTAERIHILKVLSSKEMDSDKESIALRILKQTPVSDAQLLLNGLKTYNELEENGELLINCLITKIGEEIEVSENHHADLISHLTTLIFASVDFQKKFHDLLLAEGDSRLMQWGKLDEKGFRIRAANLNDIGQLEITREEYRPENFGQIIGGYKGVMIYNPYPYITISPNATIDPFELIWFVNHSTLDVVNDELTQVGKGEVIVAPAIALQYASQKQKIDDLFTAGLITLDAVTIIASGGTALATKVHWLRRAWAVIELGGAVGNIAINTDLLPKDGSFAEVIEGYNAVMLVIGVKNLGQLGIRGVIRATQNGFLPQVKDKIRLYVRSVLRAEPQLMNLRSTNEAADKILQLKDELVKKLNLTADDLIALKAAEYDLGLAAYTNIRKNLSDAKITKAYLNNVEITDFEVALKYASKDVLIFIDKNLNENGFSEVVRGYKNNPQSFIEAVKDIKSFTDAERGWLRFWKLTPNMEDALITIKNLEGKLDMPTGNTTQIQLASIHAFTISGDILNVPMRYNAGWFGEYQVKALKHITEGLDELRKVKGRKFLGEVFSGKTYSLSEFNSTFVNGVGKEVKFAGFVSSSTRREVAEGFVELTKKWVTSNEKVAVIRRITSKEGVYIDDLSDWGKNLGPVRHINDPEILRIQSEVIMNEGFFRQTSAPIPIIENGVHKVVDGIPFYYVDFLELGKQ